MKLKVFIFYLRYFFLAGFAFFVKIFLRTFYKKIPVLEINNSSASKKIK